MLSYFIHIDILGKGLGKNENGISEALKPKLKRSVTGIGYDAAADFTEHWWSALYDKAASNVQVSNFDICIYIYYIYKRNKSVGTKSAKSAITIYMIKLNNCMFL